MKIYILGFFTCTLLTSIALNFYLAGKQEQKFVCEFGLTKQQQDIYNALPVKRGG